MVSINIKELSKQVKEITAATNHAKILDDYQYFICREIERWKDDHEYVELLRNHRMAAAACITRLAEQIKADATKYYRVTFWKSLTLLDRKSI